MSPKSDSGHTPAVEEIEFHGFAPAAIPPAGGMFVGRYLRLERSTMGFTFDLDRGEIFPWIVVFEGVSGQSADRDGVVTDIVPGQEYALWLIHTVILNSFKEAKPETDSRELFAVRNDGLKVKRGMKETDRNATYYAYSVAWPDRDRVVNAASWDDV